jgi:hypothetical protein
LNDLEWERSKVENVVKIVEGEQSELHLVQKRFEGDGTTETTETELENFQPLSRCLT